MNWDWQLLDRGTAATKSTGIVLTPGPWLQGKDGSTLCPFPGCSKTESCWGTLCYHSLILAFLRALLGHKMLRAVMPGVRGKASCCWVCPLSSQEWSLETQLGAAHLSLCRAVLGTCKKSIRLQILCPCRTRVSTTVGSQSGKLEESLCVCLCLFMCLYICVSVSVSVCLCVYAVCMSLCAWVIYVCVFVFACVVYVCMSVCMSRCVCMLGEPSPELLQLFLFTITFHQRHGSGATGIYGRYINTASTDNEWHRNWLRVNRDHSKLRLCPHFLWH